MAFPKQCGNRSGDQKQKKQQGIACDINDKNNRRQHLLGQRPDHLDHGDAVCRLRFGPLQSIVIVGIFKSCDIEL